MNGQHQLLVMLASAMSKDQIIDRIEDEIAQYKEAVLLGKSEEELETQAHHLALACNLFLMNMVTDGSMEGAMKTINRMDQLKSRDNLFNVDKN